jgi:hypothetical protein
MRPLNGLMVKCDFLMPKSLPGGVAYYILGNGQNDMNLPLCSRNFKNLSKYRPRIGARKLG